MKVLGSHKEDLINQKIFIGTTEYDSIILVGPQNNKIAAEVLNFSGSGNFTALLVEDNEEIGSNYKLVAKFDSWLKIYDDNQLVCEIWGSSIKIYRADSVGCIIQLIIN